MALVVVVALCLSIGAVCPAVGIVARGAAAAAAAAPVAIGVGGSSGGVSRTTIELLRDHLISHRLGSDLLCSTIENSGAFGFVTVYQCGQ